MEKLLKLDSFRTGFRTEKIFVLMHTRFVPRAYADKYGEHRMYLNISSQGIQKKISLNFSVRKEDFDLKTQKIIGNSQQHKDLQLLLDNINSKITQIKTYYRLSDMVLTIDKLIEEIKNNVPRGEFTSYFAHELEKDKYVLKPSTYERHKSILNNLRAYKKEIYFTEINLDFFNSYKGYFRKTRSANTYYSNLNIIKKYLRRAQKSGIRLLFDLDDVKSKNIPSKRVSLSIDETKKLYNYYFSEFILPGEKIPLGIFLFASFVSPRISDIIKLKRKDVLSGYINFNAQKTEKDHRLKINDKALKIVIHTPDLFVRIISEQKINECLKNIARKHNIKKNITIHVGRHTFATNYLRAGGKVEQLQKILGHSSLNETMGYVHIVDQEKDDSIMLMDNLF